MVNELTYSGKHYQVKIRITILQGVQLLKYMGPRHDKSIFFHWV